MFIESLRKIRKNNNEMPTNIVVLLGYFFHCHLFKLQTLRKNCITKADNMTIDNDIK